MSPTPESQWIVWLESSPNSREGLRQFCPHYYYFSLRQVIAFTGLLRQVSPSDRDALCTLADVLHEELGRGKVDRVHSKLFERFAAAVGMSPDDLQISEDAVLPGIRDYVAELNRAFGEGTLAEALAAYRFLESSAVQTYGPLLTALRRLGFTEEQLEFFALHALVEVDHAQAADDMFQRYCADATARQRAGEQSERLGVHWARFWIAVRDQSATLDKR